MAEQKTEATGPDLSELDRIAEQASQSEAEAEYIPAGEGGEGGESQFPPPDSKTLEMTETVLSVGFELVAARRGEHWRLNRTERDSLAYPLAQCLDMWLPSAAIRPELAVLVAAGMIVYPRMVFDMKLQREAVRRAREKAQGAQGQGAAGEGAGQSSEAA